MKELVWQVVYIYNVDTYDFQRQCSKLKTGLSIDMLQ